MAPQPSQPLAPLLPAAPRSPAPLPLDAHIGAVLAALAGGANAVLVASPGSGKTTRLAPALARAVHAGQLGDARGAVIMLQPRRVAARAAARRIAQEQGWTLGQEVGWHIRHERRLGPHTALRILTEGILTRQLLGDPFLAGVGCVVLDEFHERSVHSDLALIMLREIQRTVRSDLRIVVMSATLAAEPLARHLAAPTTGEPAALFRIEGRLFPVTIEHARASAATRPVAEVMAEALGAELRRPPADSGHILAFLPGLGEIRRTAEALQRAGTLPAGTELHILHSSIAAEDQDRALAPSRARKLILATNIAETSLTIEGVATVVDSGLARVALSDARLGLDRLELRRISRASAQQRAGRAGRTAPGRCLRLWTAAEEAAFEEFETPEILRVDLAGPLLALHSLGLKPSQVEWLDAPRPDALERADALLRLLEVLDDHGALTPLGQRLGELPLHPRLGRLLLAGAGWGYPRETAALAALLSEADALARAGDRRTAARVEADSDALLLLEDFLARPDDPVWGAARRLADELLRLTASEAPRHPERPENSDRPKRPVQAPPQVDRPATLRLALRRALLLAYPDRLTLRREADAARGVMVGGRGVVLEPSSCVRQGTLFLSLDPREVEANPRQPGRPSDHRRPAGSAFSSDHRRPAGSAFSWDHRRLAGSGSARIDEARVALASAVEPEWLAELLPDLLERGFVHLYDEARRRVMSRVQERFAGLLIRDQIAGPGSDRAGASAELTRWIAAHAEALLAEHDELGQWLARAELLARHLPELGWPDLGDPATLGAALAEAAHGQVGLDAIGLGHWKQALEHGLLNARQQQALAREAPEALPVPSGNRIRLHYERGGASPVLAVRLQELFGLAETPRVAAGRCPVVLHLLGPNYRPVQVTADLRNFWNTTYAEVRRDLRARYPKHPWPEDPWAAPPVSIGRRRH